MIQDRLCGDLKKRICSGKGSVSHIWLLGRRMRRKKVIWNKYGHGLKIMRVSLLCCTVVLRKFLCFPVASSAWSGHFPPWTVFFWKSTQKSFFISQASNLDYFKCIFSLHYHLQSAFCKFRTLSAYHNVMIVVIIFIFSFIFDNLLITDLDNPFTPNHNLTFRYTSSNNWLSILWYSHSHFYAIRYRVLHQSHAEMYWLEITGSVYEAISRSCRGSRYESRSSFHFWSLIYWIFLVAWVELEHDFELLTLFF